MYFIIEFIFSKMNVLVEEQLKQSIAHLAKLQVHINQVEKFMKIRRWWVKQHLTQEERETYGAYHTVFQYFKEEDHEEFHDFLGMSVEAFEKLHELTKERLEKKKTRMREPLPSELKLAAVIQ